MCPSILSPQVTTLLVFLVYPSSFVYRSRWEYIMFFFSSSSKGSAKCTLLYSCFCHLTTRRTFCTHQSAAHPFLQLHSLPLSVMKPAHSNWIGSLNSLSGCSSTQFNPCWGRWQVPLARANSWMRPVCGDSFCNWWARGWVFCSFERYFLLYCPS